MIAPTPLFYPTASRRQTALEFCADCVMHAVGLALGCFGSAILIIVVSTETATLTVTPTIVYIVTLLLSIGLSAAYNTWPESPVKRRLRRLDHSAIYLLIAGTYTPFFVRCELWSLLAAVWTGASLGAILKLWNPDRFIALSVLSYLLLGWSGVLAYPTLANYLSPTILWLILAGGITYSAGVTFHLLEHLPYHTAIWHGFVVLAGMFHFIAVYNLA